MKERKKGFLSSDNIDHNSEIFDYIRELHEYLWRFVRAELPRSSGKLDDYIDVGIEQAEYKAFKNK